jgi:hypothetical protein
MVENAVILTPGSVAIGLQANAVTWVLQDGCEIVSETWKAQESTVHVALAGLGPKDVTGNPGPPEKRLDLVFMELPAGRDIAITTDSLSPWGKGIAVGIGIGEGIAIWYFDAECRAPAFTPGICLEQFDGSGNAVGCRASYSGVSCSNGGCTCKPQANGRCRCTDASNNPCTQ